MKTSRFSFWALMALTAASVSMLRADLVWHSPLDGNATALVGADGIPTGAPISAPDKNGFPDAAVRFDDTSFYNIGALGTFSAGTISAWILSEDNSDENGAVAAGATGGGDSVYFSFMNQADGRIRGDLDDGSTRRDVHAPSGAPMVLDTWYHVAITWAAGGTMRLFIDGIEVNTQSLAGDAPPYAMSFEGMVGGERFDGSRNWIGSIDDVRIYDHELAVQDVEDLFNTGPLFAATDDTDNDGMPDLWESQYGLDPNDDGSVNPRNGPAGDPDNDQLTNINEYNRNTRPDQADTDGDGYTDFVETNDGTFNSITADTGTNPLDADTDNDGLRDGVETNDGTFSSIDTDTGTNPLLVDSDNDGMDDLWESENGLNPNDSGDRNLDPDGDQLTSFEEYGAGTHPNIADTDSDGLTDKEELDAFLDPLDPDTDDDGLIDGVEDGGGVFVSAQQTGTDPFSEDSDFDDFRDGAEVNIYGTDPNSAASVPAALSVMFVGGNAAGDQGADELVIHFLQDLYGISSVSYVQASLSAMGQEAGFDLLVLSSTFGSGDVRDKFEDSTTPIVNWEEALADNSAPGEFGLSIGALGKSTDTTQMTIDTAHPIGAGLPGTITLFPGGPGPGLSTETTFTTGLVTGLAAVGIGVDGDAAGNPMLYVADEGDALAGGGNSPDTAPARRVHLPWTDTTVASLSDDGWELMANAFNWAAGRLGVPEPTRILDVRRENGPQGVQLSIDWTSQPGATYRIHVLAPAFYPIPIEVTDGYPQGGATGEVTTFSQPLNDPERPYLSPDMDFLFFFVEDQL